MGKWDVNAARKIWCFGCPPDAKANILCDVSKGVQFLHEIKDHCVSSFTNSTGGGVICDEVLRGCRLTSRTLPCTPTQSTEVPVRSCPAPERCTTPPRLRRRPA